VKTYVPKLGEVKKEWYLIDATGKSMGRIAVEAAKLLRGKHKPQFTPFLDCGDNVVIINAEKIQITGSKLAKKIYYKHSGYPGGLKETKLGEMMRRKPTHALEHAIRGMLPHNRLGAKLAGQFRVYAGAEHGQAAQNPKPYEF